MALKFSYPACSSTILTEFQNSGELTQWENCGNDANVPEVIEPQPNLANGSKRTSLKNGTITGGGSHVK